MRGGDQVYEAWQAAKRGDVPTLELITDKLQRIDQRPNHVDAVILYSVTFARELGLGQNIEIAYRQMRHLVDYYISYLTRRNGRNHSQPKGDDDKRLKKIKDRFNHRGGQSSIRCIYGQAGIR